MSSGKPVEQFVTLFDSNYLPMGLALHDSLGMHGQPFHLWILCMDETVEEQLKRLALPDVTLMPLGSVETKELLKVKPGRTRCEYCWTVTPFTFQAVFERDSTVERVTYLDADLFFFDDPRVLLRELDDSGKHVLITEHGYAPEYEHMSHDFGRYCVQFLTFRRSEEARNVMRWWQDRCVEWCFARKEDGKFGDQTYLDAWPERFGGAVHVVRQKGKALAPWNVNYYEKEGKGSLRPVFYHFQGLRIIGPREVHLLYSTFRIGRQGMTLYDTYLRSMGNLFDTLRRFEIDVPYEYETIPISVRLAGLLKGRVIWKRAV